MSLLNLRLGLATNSSSSHSIIWLPGGAMDSMIGDEDFGWDYFTAGERDSKLKYAGHLLRYSLTGLGWSDEAALAAASDWLGVTVDPSGLIDHQSVFRFPRKFGSDEIDRQFVEECAAWLSRKDIVILGGNDNAEGPEGHSLYSKGTGEVGLEDALGDRGGVFCRKDPVHGFWSIFHQRSGTKARIYFGDKDHVIPDKSWAPELVDIKITDYCDHGCDYCYQDSTKKGKHAPLGRVEQLATALAKLQVWEVALGGGEPTQHPHFWDIVQDFRAKGIVPNFTTRDLDWIEDDKAWNIWSKGSGAFALSTESAEDVGVLGALYDKRKDEWRECTVGTAGYHDFAKRPTIQLVMGTMDRQTFELILQRAHAHHMTTTLLGYKTTGRGHRVTPQPYDWWWNSLDKLRRHACLGRIGIDTALAREFEPTLKASGLPDWLWSVHEGRHSMYVDAVGQKAGASSYVNGSEFVPLAITPHDATPVRIQRAFAQWG